MLALKFFVLSTPSLPNLLFYIYGFHAQTDQTRIKGAMGQMLPWKAPNDPKTLPNGILHDYMSCWTTLGPFGYPRGPQNGPKQHQNGLEWLKITRMAQNGTAWPQMTLKHFQWVYYMIICHVGPPWGHSGIHWGPKMAQNSTEMA